MIRFGATGAAGILLILLLVEAGLSTRRQSVGWDEGDHIFAGYMNWKNGAYYLNPEHPRPALAEAETAAALVPDGSDENRVRAEARAASGDKTGARSALHIAATAVARMEPSEQEFWRREINRKLAGVAPQWPGQLIAEPIVPA